MRKHLAGTISSRVFLCKETLFLWKFLFFRSRNLTGYAGLSGFGFFEVAGFADHWVMVPMGQYTHHERGLKNSMVIRPSTVEVSITP